jgi:phosphoribosyl-dephospho-CoA transferase
MIELEDCDEFTRIFDIDVMDATERKLGRTDWIFAA